MAKGLFDRYIWLIDTIYRAGKLHLKKLISAGYAPK